MPIYRKIYPKMWDSQDFLALSVPNPSGRYLWIYLLTNPDTTSIPGLYRSGEAQMAEALRWNLKGFRESFAEVFRQGLAKADWPARVVWVPKAIHYNEPENPNVVKGWCKFIELIPECAIKTEALQSLERYCETRGKGFAEGFAKGLRESYPDGLPNQEQEQEHEQEHEPYHEEEGARAKPASPALIPEEIFILFPCCDGNEPISLPEVEKWASLYGNVGVEQELKSMVAYWDALAKPKRKTCKGCRKSITSWLKKEQDKGRGQPAQSGRRHIHDYTDEEYSQSIMSAVERLGDT